MVRFRRGDTGGYRAIYRAIRSAGADPSAYRVQSLVEVARGQYRSWERAEHIFAAATMVLLVLIVLAVASAIRFEIQSQRLATGLRLALGAQRSRLMWSVAGAISLWSLTGLGLGIPIELGVLSVLRHWSASLQTWSMVGLLAGSVTLGVILAATITYAAAQVMRIDASTVLRAS